MDACKHCKKYHHECYVCDEYIKWLAKQPDKKVVLTTDNFELENKRLKKILAGFIGCIDMDINAKGYEIRNLQIQDFHDFIEEAKHILQE